MCKGSRDAASQMEAAKESVLSKLVSARQHHQLLSKNDSKSQNWNPGISLNASFFFLLICDADLSHYLLYFFAFSKKMLFLKKLKRFGLGDMNLNRTPLVLPLKRSDRSLRTT